MNITMSQHETLNIELPDGRIAHLFYHGCESCNSLDVWTTRGREFEEISERTGDLTRAPVGLQIIKNGAWVKVDTEAIEGSHEWPAVSTVHLIWDPDKED
jgi:hypothetical protein